MKFNVQTLADALSRMMDSGTGLRGSGERRRPRRVIEYPCRMAYATRASRPQKASDPVLARIADLPED